MQQDTPPIKDTNKNGYLDGEDILAQLKTEEAPGSTRAAHGVLESTALRIYVRELSRFVNNGTMTATSYTARTRMRLELALIRMGDDGKKREQEGIPKESLIHAAAELAAINGKTQEEMQADIANAEHNYMFGHTFAKTFPKGVKIDAKDMPEILKHLGQIATPATPPSPEEQKKLQKDMYKRS